MDIDGQVAVITGAGSGIGEAAARNFTDKGMGGQVKALALVDVSESVKEVAASMNDAAGRRVAFPFLGDVTNIDFRHKVFDEIERLAGVPSICVPAAGITRDALAVKLDKATGKAKIYDEKLFRLVLEVNLLAPAYWGLEMVARIAEDRIRKGAGPWKPEENLVGTIIFIGSVSSQGNKGQIAYAATKRGLEGVASTLMKEAMFWGVRCAVIHPGFTATNMVRQMDQEYIQKHVIPYTQLKRLIRPEEVAGAIRFMIENSAVSGELWCDAGWHPSA